MTFMKLIVCLVWLAPPFLTAQEAKVTEVLSKNLSGLPGKEGLMITVEYPPGASDPIHRHNAQGFIYVLEGSIVMQVKGGKEVTLTPGQSFYEGPDDIHVVGRNASQTQPAKFIVFLVKDRGAPVFIPANESPGSVIGAQCGQVIRCGKSSHFKGCRSGHNLFRAGGELLGFMGDK
jgi:quercetin dioxygenase-like cupin family protein